MNKSAIFKQAHALTRATMQAGDNYSATFSICLKQVIKDSKIVAPKRSRSTVSKIDLCIKLAFHVICGLVFIAIFGALCGGVMWLSMGEWQAHGLSFEAVSSGLMACLLAVCVAFIGWCVVDSAREDIKYS